MSQHSPDSSPTDHNDSFAIPTDPDSTNETVLLLQFYEETRAFEKQVGIIIPSIFAVFAFFGLVICSEF